MAIGRKAKLAVVGAGAVGASLAYAAQLRSAADEVALYDLNGPMAEAQVLDLAHGSPFAGPTKIIGGGDMAVIDGSDIVVVTAGAAQKPGQTRLELVETNARIMRELIPELVEHAPDAVFMIVTNPVDVLDVVATEAAGLPAGRVFGSGTTLDSARLRWLIAERAGVAPSNVHAMIAGEHGDSEFPLWSTAMIGGAPIREWRDAAGALPFDDDAVLADLALTAAQAAYAIIAGKGATNYAIGVSALRLVEAVLRDEKAVMPVSTVLRGYHGVDGVALSVPSIVGARGVERVLEVPMSGAERDALRKSAGTLAEVLGRLHTPG